MKKLLPMVTTMLLVAPVLNGCQTAVSPESAGTAEKTNEPVKIVTISGNNAQDKPSEQRDKVHTKLKEATGVDLQLVMVPSGQVTQKANLMMSAKEQLDVIPGVPLLDAIKLSKSGAIHTISKAELDKYPNLKNSASPEAWASVLYGDQYLGVPLQVAQTIPAFVQVRMDWLKKLNMPVPTTMDEYVAMLKKFKENDPDGNGKADTVPLMATSIAELEQAMLPFFGKSGAYWWFDESDNKLKPYELAPGYTAFLKTMKDWTDQGYLYNQIGTTKLQDQLVFVTQNKVGSTASWWTRFLYNGIEVLANSIPDVDFQPITLTGSPDAVNKYSVAQPAKVVSLITASSKHPEKALEYLDYTTSEEGQKLSLYGIEGENYNVKPNGQIEINSDKPTDWTTAQYYQLYNIHEGFGSWRKSPWPLDTWTYNLMNKLNVTIKSLPTFTPPDVLTPYDNSKFQSQSKMNDLNTLLTEAKGKVFNGTMKADEWDKVMKQWLAQGGQQLIEDKTVQYLEFKKNQ
ncbi:extracellular solute-binding protein [Paenibacillus puerhi]|uniref:extracellular solute-binding protein n=1 Tax=Paenibacillus puerhi TaxID=2692622 RepID=UPI00135909DA|nr:extracellular solute-binding protein [Paenibacillus puerhi]